MHIEYIGNILYDDMLLNQCEKVVVFGIGVHGRKVLEYLEEKGIKGRIVCLCDSNNNLEGREIMGIPVFLPQNACRCYPDATYIIGGKYSREMYFFLKENLIEKIHIVIM